MNKALRIFNDSLNGGKGSSGVMSLKKTLQESNTSSVTSVTKIHTSRPSSVTERKTLKYLPYMQNQKKTFLSNALPYERKELVNLLCAQQGEVFHRSLAH